MKTAKEIFLSLATGKLTYDHEQTIRTFNGKTKYVQLKYSIPPGFEDTWSRIFLTEVDITELKKNEKKLIDSQHKLKLFNKRILDAQERGV
jgi:hypothetical protein